MNQECTNTTANTSHTVTTENQALVQGPDSRMVVGSFYREFGVGRAVYFNTLGNPDVLLKHMRAEQGVCSASDAEPVVLLLNPDGDTPGETTGSVSMCGDNTRRAQTLRQAIRALEAVLDGLAEAGHHDGI